MPHQTRAVRIDRHDVGGLHSLLVTNIREGEDISKITDLKDHQGYELITTLYGNEAEDLLKKAGLSKQPYNKLQLGRGAFGEVLIVRRAGEYFAVKKIELEKAAINLDNYLNLLEKNSIPNVIVPIETLQAPNKYGVETQYEIMPLAGFGDGEKFVESLHGPHFSAEERNKLYMSSANSLLMTVGEMHKKNMYHNDIKLDNLLYDTSGRLFLGDFGCAIFKQGREMVSIDPVSKEGHRTNVTSGKKTKPREEFQTDSRYVPPERWRVTPASLKTNEALHAQHDSWRVGLVLLQMSDPVANAYVRENLLRVGGWRNQYENEEVAKYYQDHIQYIQNNLLQDKPRELQEIIFGLLRVDPAARMTVPEAQQRLQNFLATQQEDLINPVAIKEIFSQELARRDIKPSLAQSIELSAIQQDQDTPLADENAEQFFYILPEEEGVVPQVVAEANYNTPETEQSFYNTESTNVAAKGPDAVQAQIADLYGKWNTVRNNSDVEQKIDTILSQTLPEKEERKAFVPIIKESLNILHDKYLRGKKFVAEEYQKVLAALAENKPKFAKQLIDEKFIPLQLKTKAKIVGHFLSKSKALIQETLMEKLDPVQLAMVNPVIAKHFIESHRVKVEHYPKVMFANVTNPALIKSLMEHFGKAKPPIQGFEVMYEVIAAIKAETPKLDPKDFAKQYQQRLFDHLLSHDSATQKMFMTSELFPNGQKEAFFVRMVEGFAKSPETKGQIKTISNLIQADKTSFIKGANNVKSDVLINVLEKMHVENKQIIPSVAAALMVNRANDADFLSKMLGLLKKDNQYVAVITALIKIKHEDAPFMQKMHEALKMAKLDLDPVMKSFSQETKLADVLDKYIAPLIVTTVPESQVAAVTHHAPKRA